MPVEAYKSSYHARAIRGGNLKAAACNDCHGVHKVLPASDPHSPISKPQVGATCGRCHESIFGQYKESVHGRAVAAGVMQSPTCTDCHGEHGILAPLDPNSPVFVTNVSRVTCARCHEDQRLMARFNVPGARVPSFEGSYHGLAAQAGSKSVASCASCHGVHYILPSSDPRSTVAKANLATTCGKCHPDAGRRFAIGPVHVVPATSAGGRVLDFVRWFYLLAIPIILGGMLLHNALDWWRKARRRLAEYQASHGQLRLTLSERWQHVLLFTSFIILVITGFALKFPDAFRAAPMVRWEGVYPWRGLIHRIAAVVLMAASVYHLIYLIFTPAGRKWVRAMAPQVRDVRESVQTVGHNLGYRPSLPTYGRFNYIEKAEYWALVWGTGVMAVTGVLLWAHNLVLEYLPKTVLDVCTAIHYYEAILATFAILIWHFYWVIFDPDVYPLKWTLLTGRAPEHEIREGEEEQGTGPITSGPSHGGTGGAVSSTEKHSGHKPAP
jgi:formate dehydrogenase gamma subunit